MKSQGHEQQNHPVISIKFALPWLFCMLVCLVLIISSTPTPANAVVDITETIWKGLYIAGKHSTVSGHYDEAERSLQTALRCAGNDSRRVLLTLNALDNLYENSEQYQKEQNVLKACVIAASECLGPKNEYVALLYGKLAMIEGQLEDFDDAITDGTKAVRLLESIGTQDVDLATTLHNLGWIYSQAGQLSQAEKTYQRALKIQEQCTGTSSLLTALTRVNLAELYVREGRYSLGLALYRSALQTLSKTLGPNDPSVKRIRILYQDALRAYARSKKRKSMPGPKDICWHIGREQ